MKLWRASQGLNYNVMFSRRGVMVLAHNVHDTRACHVYANRLDGIDNGG